MQDSDAGSSFATALGALSAKVAATESAPSKGIPFPHVPGLRGCSDRIGVVGAGPSGIHMAYLLKERGFQNVDIVERNNRIGGKSFQVTYFFWGGGEEISQS